MRVLARQWNQFIVGTDYKISSLSALNNPAAYNVDQYFGTNKHFNSNNLSAKDDFLSMCTLRYRIERIKTRALIISRRYNRHNTDNNTMLT